MGSPFDPPPPPRVNHFLLQHILQHGHCQSKYSGTPILRYAKGAVKLYRYIGVSLYRNSRYSDMAIKLPKISLYRELLSGKEEKAKEDGK